MVSQSMWSVIKMLTFKQFTEDYQTYQQPDFQYNLNVNGLKGLAKKHKEVRIVVTPKGNIHAVPSGEANHVDIMDTLPGRERAGVVDHGFVSYSPEKDDYSFAVFNTRKLRLNYGDLSKSESDHPLVRQFQSLYKMKKRAAQEYYDGGMN